MMKQDIKNLKKQITYRCSYTGTKETDLFYKRIFLQRLDSFTYSDLYQISNLFINLSDPEIFIILTGKKNPPKKLKKLFKKLMNA